MILFTVVLTWEILLWRLNIYNTAGRDECHIQAEKILEPLMNGAVGSNLSIPLNVKWGSQKYSTYEKLIDDVMTPAIHVGKNISYMLYKKILKFIKPTNINEIVLCS